MCKFSKNQGNGQSGTHNILYYNCNNKSDCYNTDIDESVCPNIDNNTYQCRDTWKPRTINSNINCVIYNVIVTYAMTKLSVIT